MDKSAIRSFAIEARKILMKSAITEAGFYGITESECKAPVQKGSDFEVYETIAGTENRIYGADVKRRANLVRAIKELGFEQVIEETAYTWFNRIIAIRFMEVNNYLPTRVRVLSSETGSSTPDIVTQADTVDLNLTEEELQAIQEYKNDNKYDEAFSKLFIKQCNELNEILPGLFEKTDDYMELLLKLSYTSDGVVRMLVDTIPEDNFNVETEGQVEIIGWMYQYYNTELKDDTFAKLKKNVKITKERIPAATQLFTPDWIVRYMVENSLGRVWTEHLRAVDPSIDEKAKAEEFGWKYYLPEAEQEEDVASQLVDIRKEYKDLTPQDITAIDPCMGSGHILVYMFDVLMDIYTSEGYGEREAVFEILEHNIHGLDIDRRAYQLSYFALMMKARCYNRVYFKGRINDEGERVTVEPNVLVIEESNTINREQLKFFGVNLSEDKKHQAVSQLTDFLNQVEDAKEYGSIITIEKMDWNLLLDFVSEYDYDGQMNFEMIGIDETQRMLFHLLKQGQTLQKKYLVVVTNPPYMGLSNANDRLTKYIKKNYENSKADMFSVFIEKSIDFALDGAYIALITQQMFMFLSTYEKLREIIAETSHVINLTHLGFGTFGADFGTTSYVLKKTKNVKYYGTYCDLSDGKNVTEKEILFAANNNVYQKSLSDMQKLPGGIWTFWISESITNSFAGRDLDTIAEARIGLVPGNNDHYLRLWYEVEYEKIGFSMSRESAKNSKCRYFPYNKGGAYRKWYGNCDYVVNWENDGYEMQNTMHPSGKRIWAHNFNLDYIFKKHIAWSDLTSGELSFREFGDGFLFDSSSDAAFVKEEYFYYVLAFLNSKLAIEITKVLNPTIHFKPGDFLNMPFHTAWVKDCIQVENMAKENVELSKIDWDESEVSWNFSNHPLSRKCDKVSEAYDMWIEEKKYRIDKVINNEIEINSYFNNLYDVDKSVDRDDIRCSLKILSKRDAVVELISYAVGCMFGRYSFERDGIIYAGGKWEVDNTLLFTPDSDNIIPITDEEYFEDDIVALLCNWLNCIYNPQYLEENLEFIANALGNKGNSSREVIRNYFLHDFFKEHCNMYSVSNSGKRPIYWLFDSGKQNGFKCLIYMHRYNRDLVGLIRSDYLTKTQSAIENSLSNSEYNIQHAMSAVDRAQATKKRDKYIKQLNEIKTYYQALSHIALQRIELDLDDGVKANYSKFQDVEVLNETGKKIKINLLAKI